MSMKRKEKQRGSKGSCTVLIRLEQVEGDGLEQVIKHTDTDKKRERERKKGHSCLSFDKAGHRVFI